MNQKKLEEVLKKLKELNMPTNNCGGCIEDLFKEKNLKKWHKPKKWGK